MDRTGLPEGHLIKQDVPTRSSARLGDLRSNLRVLVGLLAVYAPIVVVLLFNRRPLAKIYLVIGAWAIEGIIWYCCGGLLAGRRRHDAAPRSLSTDYL